MRKYIFIVVGVLFIILLGTYLAPFGRAGWFGNMYPLGNHPGSQMQRDMPGGPGMHRGPKWNDPEDERFQGGTLMRGNFRNPMMMHGNHSLTLQSSTGENELAIPPILESDKISGDDVYYTVEAQKGTTEIFDGIKTKTLGYNGNFLGPVIRLKNGQTAHMTLKNNLDEATTVHWHGLVVGGETDGGPHDEIAPGATKEISFPVKQQPATLWFHPHPEGKTAKQVFEGLGGFLYIDGEADDPFVYGVNDFPLLIQDRTFTEEKQLDYRYAYHPDGTMGDTLLINGTVNPRLTVEKEKVRLRLLNGSNAGNYTLRLNNGQTFQQIASDGGLLPKPVEQKELLLTPAERAEIIIDFSHVKAGEEISLVMEDGTVLLPFVVQDKAGGKGDSGDLVNTPPPVEITEAEMTQEPSKQIELFGMGHHVLINGKKFDRNRIDFTQKVGEMEVWEIYNKPDMMGGMIHPFHLHGTQFKVISINGEAPPENLRGYKDTIALAPGDRAKIAVTFEEAGVYMYHCHILEHEDNGMMGQVLVE